MRRIAAILAVLSVVAIFTTVLSLAVLAAETTAKADASAAKTDASTKVKANAKAKAPAVPADRVVVMYFHRTQRCPTCRKMGGYSEEAVKTGFAKLMKQGKVEFYFINFQDEKNDKIVSGYGIKGPTLIVAKVVANKVAQAKNLDEMWTKVGDKDEFIAYVQGNVKGALKEARAKEARAKEPQAK
jgi:thiol-disulfide isomerase/thioredoxin